MKRDRLSDARVWRGIWRQAATDSAEHYGELVYDPVEGIALTLISAGGLPMEAIFEITGDDILHGIADGQHLTLVGCYDLGTSSNYGSASTSTQRIGATDVLVSGRNIDPEDTGMSSVRLSIEGLTKWAGRSGVSMHHYTDGRPTKVDLALTSVESIDATVDDLQYSIGMNWRLSPPSRDGAQVWSVSEEAVLSVTRQSSLSLDQALSTARSMQALLSLVNNTPCSIDHIELFDVSSPHRSHVAEIYSASVLRAPSGASTTTQTFPVFTLQDLSLEDVMRQWAGIRTSLLAPLDIVTALHFNKIRLMEAEFSLACAAAESMYRSVPHEPPLSAGDFQALREAVISGVPSQHVGRVKGLLRNEASFKIALEGLAESVPTACRHALVPNASSWAKHMRDARNALLHKGSSNNGWERTLAATQVAVALVRVRLLVELGASEGQLVRAVERNPGLARASRMGASSFTNDDTSHP